MFGSFLLGLLAPLVLVVGVLGGFASASTIGGGPAIAVIIGAVFLAAWFRYLSRQTMRIRK